MALNAGDITFKLLMDDKEFRAGLSSATRAVGAAMTAAGAAITGFAAVSIRDFAQAGDEVQKMADRTGFSTEALSELRHAAELSGTGLDSIEKATKNFSRVLDDAQKGVTSASDTLAYLNLTVDDLVGKSPEQQFMMVASALAEWEEPTSRAAMAMEIWGARAGTALLPMLSQGVEGLTAMREEAHRLGIVFDQEAANKAAAFNDAMQRMGESFTSFKYDVAEALIPTLIELMDWVQGVMVTFREWRDANPALVDSIIKITTVIGGVMAVLGPLLILLPGLATAWGAVTTAVTAVVAALGAIAAAVSAPVAVVVAAIGAIALAGAALYNYWDEVKAALTNTWNYLADLFWTIFGPILYAWEKVKGWVGSDTGSINPAALDRYNESQNNANFATAPGANARAATNAATAAGAPRGGNGGGVNIQSMTVVTNDPERASAIIAEQLALELSARGFAF